MADTINITDAELEEATNAYDTIAKQGGWPRLEKVSGRKTPRLTVTMRDGSKVPSEIEKILEAHSHALYRYLAGDRRDRTAGLGHPHVA